MQTKNGFINRTAELEFILTKLDGRIRCDMLGIKKLHYLKKELANEWYNNLSEESKDCTNEAKEKLYNLYSAMVNY